MKKISLTLALLFALNATLTPVFATDLTSLQIPLAPKNKLGLDGMPETEITLSKAKKEDAKTTRDANAAKTSATTTKDPESINNSNLTYADLSLKRIADDVLADLEVDAAQISSDLETLWLGVAKKSETVRFAIYKLSNPEEDKPSNSLMKKIIRPVASFSTIAGTAFSTNPFVASGALIGGNLLGGLTQDSKELNYKFSKVSDTDMVLLVRKIDKLQERLLENYIEYKTRQLVYDKAVKNLKNRERIYLAAQKKSREELMIADVYFRNAQNFEKKAGTQYWITRQSLEQFAGAEALKAIEDASAGEN